MLAAMVKPASRPTSRASEALAAALDAGRWPAMSRLPGEMHLAAELGVARGTVRRALQRLAAQGRLIAKPHAGFLVAPGGAGGAPLAGTVVLVTATGLLDFPFAEEYPAATVIGAQRGAAGLGAHLLLITTARWDAATQEAMAARRPAAVVIADIIGDDRAIATATAARLPGIPLVWHADPDDAPPGIDCAAADQAQGGRLLVGAARERRRRAPLLLDTVRSPAPWWRRRREAIAAAWAEAGLPLRCVPTDIAERSDRPDAANFSRRARIYAGYLAEELAAGRRPDAIFVTSDSDVPPLTAACRLAGLDPGRDLDVFGFDGYWSRTWEREREPLPPLATVRANHVTVGQRLLALALRGDREANPRQAERIPVELLTLR